MYRALSPVPDKPFSQSQSAYIQTPTRKLTYHKIDIISPVLVQIIKSVVCK